MSPEEVDLELFLRLGIGNELADASETCSCVIDEDIDSSVCSDCLLDDIRCHVRRWIRYIEREPFASGLLDLPYELRCFGWTARSSYDSMLGCKSYSG